MTCKGLFYSFNSAHSWSMALSASSFTLSSISSSDCNLPATPGNAAFKNPSTTANVIVSYSLTFCYLDSASDDANFFVVPGLPSSTILFNSTPFPSPDCPPPSASPSIKNSSVSSTNSAGSCSLS